MTPLLARSLWDCNGVERDAFRQHRGTFAVSAIVQAGPAALPEVETGLSKAQRARSAGDPPSLLVRPWHCSHTPRAS